MSIKVTSKRYAGLIVGVFDSKVAFDKNGDLLGVVLAPGMNEYLKKPKPISPSILAEMKTRSHEFTVTVEDDPIPEPEPVQEPTPEPEPMVTPEEPQVQPKPIPEPQDLTPIVDYGALKEDEVLADDHIVKDSPRKDKGK